MRKVLIINTVLFGYNGITKVITNYYENMPKEDLDIHILACCGTEIPSDIKNQLKGAEIIELSNRKKNVLSYIKELNSLMKRNKYDVVHINGNSATMSIELFIAYVNGVKERIVHAHSAHSNYKIANYILKPVMNSLMTKSLACSDKAGSWLLKNKDYIVLKNAIKIKDYAYNPKVREEYRQRLGLKDSFVVGHIGLVNSAKNHSFLIDIFNEICKLNSNSVLMLISGSPCLSSELQCKINDLGLKDRVVFLTKRNDVHNLMQAMDVFVFPSLYEGLGLVAIEAQSASLPCLLSEGVPLEAKLTDLAYYMSLKSEPKLWANKAMEIYEKTDRENVKVCDSITKAGYNIENNSRILYDIYKGDIK